MTVLLTQCPHCQTSFRVSSAQLSAANGLVRCGSCLGVFSAVANEIRVKHPDGYVVEELEHDDDDTEETAYLEQAEAAEDDTEHADAGYRDEQSEESDDEHKLEHDEQYEAEALTAPPAAPEISRHTEEDFEDAEENNEWQDNEPAVSFGDMQLDDDIDEELDEAAEVEPEPETFDEEAADSAEIDLQQVDGAAAESTLTSEPLDESSSDDPIDSPIYRHTPPSLASRARPIADKQELHAHLSELTDDDALDPLGTDLQLDSLEALPVTIDSSSNLRRRLTQVALLIAAVVLILALPVPWLYAHRDTLSTHRRFSFMAPLVCKMFTCQPPAAGVATSLYSQQLLVRSHPKYQGALEVSFVFHNDSTLPQPFPNLELAFSDVNNVLLANRLFTPQEYLPPELRPLREMPASSSVQILLEVADPGAEAVNYTVKLHTP